MDITFREIREFGESIVYLDQHPSQLAVDDPRWAEASTPVKEGADLPRAMRVRSMLVVWAPYLASVLVWAVAAAVLLRSES